MKMAHGEPMVGYAAERLAVRSTVSVVATQARLMVRQRTPSMMCQITSLHAMPPLEVPACVSRRQWLEIQCNGDCAD